MPMEAFNFSSDPPDADGSLRRTNGCRRKPQRACIALVLIGVIAVIAVFALSPPPEQAKTDTSLVVRLALRKVQQDPHSAVHAHPFGEIEVGTPGQVVTVLFDTGSADMVVPSRLGTDSVYNHNMSSTYKGSNKTVENDYGQGSCTGYICTETFKIGAASIAGITFMEAYDFKLDRANFQGIFGIGGEFPPKDDVSTPLHMLLHQLAAPVFAFYFGPLGNIELILGGSDETHYAGELHYVPCTHSGYRPGTVWEVALDGVRFNGKRLESEKQVLFDSGQSVIVLPVPTLRYVMSSIDAVYDDKNMVFRIPCDKQVPDLTFTLGGKDFTLSREDFIVKWENECFAQFFGGGYIIGQPFLRKYYVQFDYGDWRIGIATAAYTAEQEAVT